MSKSEKPISVSYESAYEELLEISKAIENDSISIDQLSEKVARAAELVAFCQEKLKKAENDVSKVIDQMKPSQSA